MLSIISALVMSALALAELPVINWPWTAAQPVVFSSIPATRPGDYWCTSTVIQKHYVAGMVGLQDVCMMANSTVRFGLVNSTYGITALVGFGNDTQLHQINNICTVAGQCIYLSDTDILVTKKLLFDNRINSLVIYKNFSSRLNATIDTLDQTIKYTFNDALPEYQFKTASGFAWPIMGLGASNNGKWLAVEIKARALGLLNLETMQMKRVSQKGYSYDVFIPTISELAVSNDGSHIFWMGQKADLVYFDIDASCGDIATESNLSMGTSILHPCIQSRFHNTSGLITSFDYGTWPKFSDDGGQLDFFAYSKDLSSNRVNIRAAGYQLSKLPYLAMGDSYSSGEGETEDQYYIQGTNSEFEKCHTSSRSYPFTISDLLGLGASNAISVACTGAMTIDIVGDDNSYLGQGGRLGLGYLNLGDLGRQSFQLQALESFVPGRVLQNNFVKKYSPSVITIGIGGNDAGFMDKLSSCLAPGTCKWASSVDGRERTALQIKGLYRTLVNTYKQIREVSPWAKIYAIGYPKIIDPNGSCNANVNALFDKVERQFIVDSISYLNQVISAAADSAGVKYVDIYDGFGDHVICGSDTSAMNTIKIGDDIGPFDNAHWYRFIGQESFHPNSLGHSLTAQAIINKVGNIFTGLIGQINPATGVVPEPPAALLPDGYHNLPTQVVADFVTGQNGPSPNLDIEISMPERSFTPNSSISIVLYDDPTYNWQFFADEHGGLQGRIMLPEDFEKLGLIMYLRGTSFSGEPIEISEIVNTWDPNEPPDVVIDDLKDPDVDDEDDDDGGDVYPVVNDPIPPVVPPIIEVLIPDGNVLPPTIVADTLPLPQIFITEPEVLGVSAAKVLPSIIDKPAVKNATDIKNAPSKTKSVYFEPSWLIPRLIILIVIIIALIIRKILRVRNK